MKRYGHPDTANGWHFLTGTQPNIDALTKAVGFGYVKIPGPDGRLTQFAHASSIQIVTSAGKDVYKRQPRATSRIIAVRALASPRATQTTRSRRMRRSTSAALFAMRLWRSSRPIQDLRTRAKAAKRQTRVSRSFPTGSTTKPTRGACRLT